MHDRALRGPADRVLTVGRTCVVCSQPAAIEDLILRAVAFGLNGATLVSKRSARSNSDEPSPGPRSSGLIGG
jgi:hypothetical protein